MTGALFLTGLFESTRRSLQPHDATGDLHGAELEVTLITVYDAARAAWPGVHVEAEVFIPYLAARIPNDVPVRRALTSIVGGDLYLACACAQGDAAAIAAFEANLLRDVDVAIARINLGSAALDDVKGNIRYRILVGEEGAPPRILDYTGRGDLRGWLRVVAVREALGMARRQKREAPVDHIENAVLPLASDDPELAHLDRLYREEFRAAFRDALAALTPRERNLLRQHYPQDLSIDQLGALYNIHRATAARWVARARERLFSGIRRRMLERLQVSRDELESILRLIQSRLEITLRSHVETIGGVDDEIPKKKSAT